MESYAKKKEVWYNRNKKKKQRGNMANLTHQRIVSLRDYKGWTQADLAERADIEPSYISKLERGKAPNVAGIVLAKLATALETSTDYLLGLTDDPAPRPMVNNDSLTDPRLAYIVNVWHFQPEYAKDIFYNYVKQMEVLNPDVRRAMKAAGVKLPPLPDGMSPETRKLFDE